MSLIYYDAENLDVELFVMECNGKMKMVILDIFVIGIKRIKLNGKM